jgi:hypothetical protein
LIGLNAGVITHSNWRVLFLYRFIISKIFSHD